MIGTAFVQYNSMSSKEISIQRIFGVLANLGSVQSFMIFGDLLAEIVSRK